MLQRMLMASALCAGLVASVCRADARPRRQDLVYTETNDAARNELLVFRPRNDGTLESLGRVPTGGRGSGAGLGSQGALALSDDRLWLVAVNAGSDEVSLFFVGEGRPLLRDVAPSGGPHPKSAAIRDGLVYVLNDDSVVGMEISWHGGLVPIEGGRQPLSTATSKPAQVSFTPDGDALIVTEQATGCIDELRLDDDGRAHPLVCHPSVGQTPFGFAFAPRGPQHDRDAATLIVSEAFGGAPGASAATSYRVDDAAIDPITRSAPTTQTAACWIAVTPDSRFAYTTNTGSGTVTGFRVTRRGALERLDAGVTGVTGGAPIDAAVSRDGDTLYVLVGGGSSLVTFVVERDGGLTRLGDNGGLPPSTVGLVVR